MSRQHGLFLPAAAALFVGVSVLLFAVDDPGEAAGMLFVLPIALLALRFGARGGVAAAAASTAVIVSWYLHTENRFGTVGWIARLVALFTLGLLVGGFEDLIRSYERRVIREQHAREVQDDIVQNLVVARYQLGAGEDPSAAVDDALTAAKDIVTRGLGDDLAPGDLRRS